MASVLDSLSTFHHDRENTINNLYLFYVLLLGSLFKLQRNPHKIVSGFFLRLLTSKLVNDIADICENLVSMNLFLLINFIDSEMQLKLYILICVRENDGGWASTSKPAHVYHGVCGSQRTILGNGFSSLTFCDPVTDLHAKASFTDPFCWP